MTPAARTPERIVLIGPMAAGKSTVGSRLAQRLGLEFVDTDHEFEKKHGPISRVFESLGEPFFREAEARLVASSLARRDVVVSLGGGAVLDAGTAQLLTREYVVYLQTDVETVRPFITRDRRRPLLSENPVEAWERVYDRRRSTYERLATRTIDVASVEVRRPEAIVGLILDGLAEPDTTDQHESKETPR
ncbi:shikimate kinase [Falsarthrobacter nasiphocae]|uniref:Shikimate kinase n=1 Tax=Falsarthrobacter nasiphocae TaxID=189863 RepID=A0AAE3YGF4_9MICC|nr:shikimate kinase [Falsarthrobacter nasiphocae]MDR6892979.1 shikimate kinase [Falsarthrobacter nasiphocae]